MKEIELRLALVFYGGVSLAIYMHGVSREVLNLVRASACRSERIGRNGVAPSKDRPPSPTEKAYQQLLDKVGQVADIRVVADAIAGASAGGVNGIMLARAITHDLPLDSHRALWLENADVSRLARPQNGLTRYLKSSVSPVLDRLISSQLKKQIKNPETREKLRLFMQSRWFTPPFSGSRYIGWMLDACGKMDEHFRDGSTLIPRGQTLDLFVTLTDYSGRKRRIHIDDPAFIEEWDHRRILNFHAVHRGSGNLVSQFGEECVPELVFAARATSSFPGAFPPATVSEMDHVLKKRKSKWPHRAAFLQEGLCLQGEGMEQRCFVDGSVVMNKPFAPIIDVIRQRPAAREVARRLIYVDPVPAVGDVETKTKGGVSVPGFFRVILASLAHIPRNEPIGDELREIEAQNRRGRWLSETIAAADPVVEKAVQGILPSRPKRLRPAAVTKYRSLANAAAHTQAGYAYLNYQSLKLHAISERLASLISELARSTGREARQDTLMRCISDRFAVLAKPTAAGPPKPDSTIVSLLRGLDVDYRIRRLRFVIRKLNGFYSSKTMVASGEINPDALDALKSRLYEQIDHLTWRWQSAFYGPSTRGLAECLCAHVVSENRRLDLRVGEHLLADVFDQLSAMMGLDELDRMQDELIAGVANDLLLPEVSLQLTRAYVGFAFYDLVTFPVLQRNDFSEVNETLVDRISPHDANTLHVEGFELKGKSLNGFGAFFNRSWREHDYLWGRLNAADRLINVVVSAAGADALDPETIEQSRHEVFQAILEEEEVHLEEIPEVFETLRKQITLLRQN